MAYVLIILLIVFCAYEGYSMFRDIRKRRQDKKNKEFENSEQFLNDHIEVVENSQEDLQKGEKE